MASALNFDICIDVADVPRAVDFYSRGLGMELVEQKPEWAKMAHSGITFWVMKIPAGSAVAVGSSQTRDYGRHWTPVHLDIPVPDLDAAVKRAVEAGGRLENMTPGKLATIADPSGNGFDLVRRPAKS
jgi:catechol 2,3-dioxygenase-like lactoylglutathione lyase family enzyme